MKRLSEYNNIEIDDCVYTMGDLCNLYRLMYELLIYEKVVVSLEECISIWSEFSSSYQAGWLDMNSMNLVEQIKRHERFFTSWEDLIRVK